MWLFVKHRKGPFRGPKDQGTLGSPEFKGDVPDSIAPLDQEVVKGGEGGRHLFLPPVGDAAPSREDDLDHFPVPPWRVGFSHVVQVEDAKEGAAWGVMEIQKGPSLPKGAVEFRDKTVVPGAPGNHEGPLTSKFSVDQKIVFLTYSVLFRHGGFFLQARVKASTTRGSNWIPARSWISCRASSGRLALR